MDNLVCSSKSFSANIREDLVIWVQFTKNLQLDQEIKCLSFLSSVVFLPVQKKIVQYGNNVKASQSKKNMTLR